MGKCDGRKEGVKDGKNVGKYDGCGEGSQDGKSVGKSDGSVVGTKEGCDVGKYDGFDVGASEEFEHGYIEPICSSVKFQFFSAHFSLKVVWTLGFSRAMSKKSGSCLKLMDVFS